jgi:sporulation protein YlmC with PRC-barrel domain
MLRDLKTLRGFALKTSDGEIGSVRDVYFDDLDWVVRYLVVDTGSWLTGRTVLIVPKFLGTAEDTNRTIPVALTRKKVEDSPSIETNKPVTRQHETEHLRYYGLAYYWPETMIGGFEPSMVAPEADTARKKPKGDPNLQSSRDLINFPIRANDGELGHVQDFVLDDRDWTIRYLVVNTTNWWPGGLVLVSPKWIEHIDWKTREVRLAMERETLRQAPPYHPSSPITLDYEDRLLGYYQPHLIPTGDLRS